MRTWSGPRGQSFYTDFNPPSTARNWTVRFNWSGDTGKVLIRLLRPGQSADSKGPAQEVVVRRGMNTVTLEASGPVKQLSIHTGEAWNVEYTKGEVFDVSISNKAMASQLERNLTNETTPAGGIDLNSKNLDLQIKRDEKGMPLPLKFQNLDKIKIDALYPVILNIAPVTNLPILLGLDKKTSTPLAKLFKLGVPYDRLKIYV